MSQRVAPTEFSTSAALRYATVALLVLMLPAGLVGYAYWILPQRLPEQTSHLLRTSLQAYDSAVAEKDSASRISRLAATVDLCFQRLELLDPSAVDAWQRVAFYGRHAAHLRDQVKNETQVPELEQQAEFFGAKHAQLMAQLARVGSTHFRDANLWLLRTQFDSLDPPRDLARQVGNLNKILDDDPGDDEVRTLLASSFIEQAWLEHIDQVGFGPDLPKLDRALTILGIPLDPARQLDNAQISTAEISTQAGNAQLKVSSEKNAVDSASKQMIMLNARLTSQRDLILAALAHIDPSRAIELAQAYSEDPLPSGYGVDHVDCLLGRWSRVEGQVTQELAHQQLGGAIRQAFLLRASRQIGRILLSPLAAQNAQWCAQAPQAVALLLRLDPGSPETSSFLWNAALQHAGQASMVPAELVQAILVGNVPEASYLLLTLSNAIVGASDEGKRYLEFAAKRNPMALDRIASVGLWYVFRDDAYLDSWQSILECVVSLEVDNGSAWFALGTIHFRRGRFEAAGAALKRADELLPETDALQAMLGQCTAEK